MTGNSYLVSTWQQFGASIDMLDQAILGCPDELWGNRSQQPELWYVAYHTLFWLDLYLAGSVDGFAPPSPFTLGELEEGVLPDRVYTRNELRGYLAYCREKCQTTISGLTDERAKAVCKFGRFEISFFELLLYNMRHVQEHAAQISLILGTQIGWSADWIAKAKKNPA
jgi:hypothetical protein